MKVYLMVYVDKVTDEVVDVEDVVFYSLEEVQEAIVEERRTNEEYNLEWQEVEVV